MSTARRPRSSRAQSRDYAERSRGLSFLRRYAFLASLETVARLRSGGTALFLFSVLAACHPDTAAREPKPSDFPAAHRPVASIVSPRWSDEPTRDKAGEATDVMNRAGVKRGMTVADIGAGEGYYTIRLATRIGKKGRVLAEDIVPQVRDALAERVTRERLDAVSVRLGEPDDPKLPEASFDRVFMVHMYHEIESPYAFLWNLRPSVKPGGRVIVVDADRPTNLHGTPPKLLECEFAAVGYRMVDMQTMPAAGGYLAAFVPAGARPEPKAIRACEVAE
ncbi:MAG: class I SAM-dependent methyltransferase [Sphingomonadaceae bacterium]|nr:class I SAM-dependent methyltransferase [Sphingomonadaceae bacterium]